MGAVIIGMTKGVKGAVGIMAAVTADGRDAAMRNTSF